MHVSILKHQFVIHIAADEDEDKVEQMVFDIFVILVSVFSSFLCIRSLYRAHNLRVVSISLKGLWYTLFPFFYIEHQSASVGKPRHLFCNFFFSSPDMSAHVSFSDLLCCCHWVNRSVNVRQYIESQCLNSERTGTVRQRSSGWDFTFHQLLHVN